MSNSDGPRRRRVPSSGRGAASRAARRIAVVHGDKTFGPRTPRRRRHRIVDLRFDGRAAMAWPARLLAEASLDRSPAFSMAAVNRETGRPSISRRSVAEQSRARLQRETLSDWRRMFSEKSVGLRPRVGFGRRRACARDRAGRSRRFLPDAPCFSRSPRSSSSPTCCCDRRCRGPGRDACACRRGAGRGSTRRCPWRSSRRRSSS